MIKYNTDLWQEVATAPGQIRVDDAGLKLEFATLYRNIKGSEVVAQVGQQKSVGKDEVKVYGNVEVARCVNYGRGTMANKWAARFKTPDYVIRVGSMIIYADERNYERAIEIALGERKGKTWITQEVSWVSHDGEETVRQLVFLNLTRHRKVPPAKWFLHRPAEFRFDRKKLSPMSVALGYTKVGERLVAGEVYPIYGKLERYGGVNSFVVTEQTLLPEVVSEWISSCGWFVSNHTAVRKYDNNRAEAIRLDEKWKPSESRLFRFEEQKVVAASAHALATAS